MGIVCHGEKWYSLCRYHILWKHRKMDAIEIMKIALFLRKLLFLRNNTFKREEKKMKYGKHRLDESTLT